VLHRSGNTFLDILNFLDGLTLASLPISGGASVAETISAIYGATSALGQAVARRLVAEGESLVLVARDATKLAIVADDLSARGGQVSIVVTDFDNLEGHEQLLEATAHAQSFWFFFGSLPNQKNCEQSWQTTAAALNTNFLSVLSLLTRIANLCEQRGSGCIVVVSSVAGDRGRESNYVYGTAKGALSLFCQGMRNRLTSSGVQVLTVKPGFIDTPMTRSIEKKPAILWSTPERVADDIMLARQRGKDVLYTPWFWRYILILIRLIPEPVFKRLSL
jgi:short-subunit dehydrogenase